MNPAPFYMILAPFYIILRYWNAVNMAVMCLLSLFIILAFNRNYTVNIKTNTSEHIHINKLFTGNITHASRFGETSNLNISFSLLFSKSRSLMVFVGHVIRYYRPAIRFAADSHLPPNFIVFVNFPTLSLRQTQTSTLFAALFRPAPYLFRTKLASFAILLQPPFHCRRRTRANLFTLLLLIIGGVEVNPGPTSNFRLGVLNTRSIVNKAPLLHSLMDDNEISILALTETWIRSDDPPVIKNGPAPPGYRILHVHRDSNQPAGSDLMRGGGLALIYQDGIQISPHKHQIIHTSFELQLVNICSPGRDFRSRQHLSPSFRKQVNLSC